MTPTKEMPTFLFDRYTLRAAAEGDLDLAKAWTSEDVHHAGLIAPEFWLRQSKGEEAWILQDERGPVFFFHMQNTIRALIQFGPTDTWAERERTQQALMSGMKWLEAMLGSIGKHELIFDTQSLPLKLFCVKRLGFEPTPDMLTKRLFVKG